MTNINFHTRERVGLGPIVPARLALRTADDAGPHHVGLTAHHVGDGGTLFHPDPVMRLRNIWAYHVHVLGYGDIAYNGGFDADGNVFSLRDGRYVSAHAQSTDNAANRLTDGIVFLEDRRGITPAALAGFRWWSDVYAKFHGKKPCWFGHRYWGNGHGGLPTFCPGDDWARVVTFIGGHS